MLSCCKLTLMFNNVALDVAIGLVFIFLLYSLLATSVKEGIATIFALRARTLREGIINGMLSDTPVYGRWKSIGVGIWSYLKQCIYIITGNLERKQRKLGNLFYDHPLIKNYGSSRIFPYPSYIPSSNFSTVLIDVLKQDFNGKIEAILRARDPDRTDEESLRQAKQDLLNSADAIKIKLLLEYYGSFYLNATKPPAAVIDEDTWRILEMHLRNSIYNLENFSKKLEDWFNDSMHRVSGWYKRRAQVILFIIGICMAVIFNIDTIAITGKLSKSNTLREELVQTAIAYHNRDSSASGAGNRKLAEADSLLQHDVRDVSNLLALGWGDYGSDDTLFIRKLEGKIWVGPFYVIHAKDSFDRIRRMPATLKPGGNRDSLRYTQFYRNQVNYFPVHVKTAYVWYMMTHGKKKLLGFLITALAISLGAPFWFDLLNKFINLRAAGKRENDEEPGQKEKPGEPAVSPVNVTVNTQPGQEAAG